MEYWQQEPWTEEEWKVYVDRVIAEGDPEPEPVCIEYDTADPSIIQYQRWEWVDVPYPLNIIKQQEEPT